MSSSGRWSPLRLAFCIKGTPALLTCLCRCTCQVTLKQMCVLGGDHQSYEVLLTFKRQSGAVSDEEILLLQWQLVSGCPSHWATSFRHAM